jgi:DNA-directed RNA polymerase subunit RPC12/RpoP
MKYVVRLQKASVSFAETIIDAESMEEARGKTEAEVNLRLLCWVCPEVSIEIIGIDEVESPKEPRCPYCGAQNFRELQTVYEAQKVSWNADGNFLEYGHAEFQEMASVTGIECASCGEDLGEDFFQPWHQGKTRSEIYGEHETTNNTKGDDQHD